MTVLKDSSDRLSFSSLALPITIAEVEGERFLAWDMDLRWFLAFCCADLMTWFHLQIPSWSFMASTTPTLAATKALLVWLIFYILFTNSLLNLLFNLKTTNSTNFVWLIKLIEEWYVYIDRESHGKIVQNCGDCGNCRWFWRLESQWFFVERTTSWQ
jgi:hypothetical protein